MDLGIAGPDTRIADLGVVRIVARIGYIEAIQLKMPQDVVAA
ncbi:hypothetical protein [Antarctobacter heliothermus]|nr:hypothetical protein [Antarctobacter heliothermus]